MAVWLGFLPYTIRQVWRLLFWFSDGGWPTNHLALDSIWNSTGVSTLQALELAGELQQLAILPTNGTTPATPLHAAQTTPASVGLVLSKLAGIFNDGMNLTNPNPLASGFFKSVLYGLGIQPMAVPEGPPVNMSMSEYFMNLSPSSRSPTLLSEISFLRDMTKHPYLNHLMITVLEGYVITFAVVVAFILVFLIREWVVQQQPGINMGAGFNADLAAAGQRDGERQAPRGLIAPEEEQNLPNQNRLLEQRPMARPRRRNPQFGEPDDAGNDQIEAGHDATAPPNRPVALVRNQNPAPDIQRGLTEEPQLTEDFLAIWRRAEGNPDEVLRIIEGEGKSVQMGYWVNAMGVLQRMPEREMNSLRIPASPAAQRAAQSPQPGSSQTLDEAAEHTYARSPPTPEYERTLRFDPIPLSRSDSQSHMEPPVLQKDRLAEDGLSSQSQCFEKGIDKGKGKALDEDQGETSSKILKPASRDYGGMWNPKNGTIPEHTMDQWDTTGPHVYGPSYLRPRAVSDGPQMRETTSPYAKDSWSFGNLSEVDTVDQVWVFSKEKENKKLPNTNNLNIDGSSDQSSGSVQSNPQTDASQAWKAAQDLRVQQAIAKGREAHKSALNRHEPAIPTPPAEVAELSDDELNWEHFVNFEDDDETGSENGSRGLEDQDLPALIDEAEPNPFRADVPLPPVREPIVPRPAERQGFLLNVADFLWGGVGDDRHQDEPGPNDEHIVQDLAAEAPFVPVVHQDPFEQAARFPQQDREAVEAVMAAGLDPNDPDAIEDAEDFEGIMELVGMRGPIFSLAQNAIFSAFLLALTVAVGVWIPYNIGRASFMLLANPGMALKFPLILVYGIAAFLQDLALSVIGLISYCLIAVLALPLNIWSACFGTSNTTIVVQSSALSTAALNVSQNAFDRVLEDAVHHLVGLADSELLHFSASSHESLIFLKSLIVNTISFISDSVMYVLVGDYGISWSGFVSSGVALLAYGRGLLAALPAFLAKPDTFVISLEISKRTQPLDLELSLWSGMDRCWATLAGYTALCVLGALYVRKGSPFSTGQVGRDWEATFIDLLNQAGGVMKVILIISIEMLVFPLYCGLLLDAALLPLFEGTTIMSRILFTLESPFTSIFVHWFVGTCYMFHFALFVSMCRKIMRKGVLCKFKSQIPASMRYGLT
jgi:E3 ubiquitin-protein ligase MARCH6